MYFAGDGCTKTKIMSSPFQNYQRGHLYRTDLVDHDHD